MAFCIMILKTGQEDEYFVYYTYKFSICGEEYKSRSGKTRYKSKEVCGIIKIDKRNGDVHTVELAEGDSGMHAQRAGWALMRHWEKGEYPDTTSWES